MDDFLFFIGIACQCQKENYNEAEFDFTHYLMVLGDELIQRRYFFLSVANSNGNQ